MIRRSVLQFSPFSPRVALGLVVAATLVGSTVCVVDLSRPTITLARWREHLGGDQRRTALAPLADAIGAAWNDYGKVFGTGQWNPDVVVTRIPAPILRLETDGGS